MLKFITWLKNDWVLNVITHLKVDKKKTEAFVEQIKQSKYSMMFSHLYVTE